MLQVFTWLADWLTYSVFSLEPGSALAGGVHFFIEDTSKILVLLLVLIYIISFIRAGLNAERVRDYLAGRHRGIGYLMGSVFGAVTPFCSCSSIPLFMGFVSARIPVGITMSFLITSPLINEVVIIMLGGMLGLKFTLMYLLCGILLGVLAGVVIDLLKAERWLQPFLAKAYQEGTAVQSAPAQHEALGFEGRHQFARDETLGIFRRIWKWVLIGVGIGAFIHGYVPEGWVDQNLSAGQWWSVPVAAAAAIPMYVNASGVVPVMASLIAKGVPLGTTLAFCMAAVAVSLPEFMMLKQVMRLRLLALVAGYVFVSITVIGWIFNWLY